MRPQHFVVVYFTKNRHKLVKKLAKLAEKPLKCSPGPPQCVRVFVNAQGVFIWHYTVQVCQWALYLWYKGKGGSHKVQKKQNV